MKTTSKEKWRNIELGDVLIEICNGTTTKQNTSGIGIPVTRIETIQNSRFDMKRVHWIDDSSVDLQKWSYRDGDIAFSHINSETHVGKVALYKPGLGQLIHGMNLLRLRPNGEIIEPEFLFYTLQTLQVRQQIRKRLKRAISQASINQKDLKEMEISIPSKSTQKLIVNFIHNSMTRVNEIYDLYQQNIEAVTSLKRSLVYGEQRSDRDWVEVDELVDWIKDTEPVSDTETYNFVGAKSFGKGLFHSATRTTKDFKYKELRRLKHRDFTYPKLMAWEGAFGMVPKEFDGFVVSPEFVVFRTKDGIICPEVLDTYFRSPICLEDVRNASTGSNKRRRRLNPQAFLKLKVPVPPHDVQEQLKKVYEFEAKAAESWKDLPETLEKIRQGILKKAFSGEL